MGRYYSGDIEGKFWLGVQSSDDASFFGGDEIEPQYIEYYFDESHLDTISHGITTCELKLGEYKDKLDGFFKGHTMWNEDLLKEAGIPADTMSELVEWYARLGLGTKILRCVQEKGSCNFEAEL
jgi:hypothetical protein